MGRLKDKIGLITVQSAVRGPMRRSSLLTKAPW